MQNFGSYYEIPAISNIDPDKPLEVLSGTETTGLVNATSLLASVTNPYNAIDGNESIPATLATVANVLAQQQSLALFPGIQPGGTYAYVLLGL